MWYLCIFKRYTFTSDAAVRVRKNILPTLKHNVHIRRCSARLSKEMYTRDLWYGRKYHNRCFCFFGVRPFNDSHLNCSFIFQLTNAMSTSNASTLVEVDACKGSLENIPMHIFIHTDVILWDAYKIHFHIRRCSARWLTHTSHIETQCRFPTALVT